VLSAVAGWLVRSGENGRAYSHPLFRDQLDQIVRLLDTAEAAVSRTMGAGWRAGARADRAGPAQDNPVKRRGSVAWRLFALRD